MAFKKKKRKETRHLLFSSLKIRVSLVRFRLRALVTDGGMVALADRTTCGQRVGL